MKKITIPFSLANYIKYENNCDIYVEDKDGNISNCDLLCLDASDNKYPVVVDHINKQIESYTSDGICKDDPTTKLIIKYPYFEHGELIETDSGYPYMVDKQDDEVIYVYKFYQNTLPTTELLPLNEKYDLITNPDDFTVFFNVVRREFELEWKGDHFECLPTPFKIKDWCLMRTLDYEVWTLCQFSHKYKGCYVAVGGMQYKYCIPFTKDTECIVGTNYDLTESK